jgi:hypothetical protein
VQAFTAVGASIMTLGLAVSLFVDVSPTEARPKVLLFLLISFVPFLVVAPLIGPLVDRMAGGRLMVLQIVTLARAFTLLLMAFHINDVLLYPIAFAALVLDKTQSISRSALVPSLVRDEADLVEANSKLGLIVGVFGFLAAGPAALVQRYISVQASLTLGALVFVAAFVAATQLPREIIASKRVSAQERAELRSVGIILAASAMAFLRASVGFCFFLLAFWLRKQDAGLALFGTAIALSTIAITVANAIAPTVRKSFKEETILIGSIGLTALAGVLSALFGGVVSGLILAVVVNFSAALGKLSFDSIVQRDAPDANQGRAFAQFETRFQLAWVLGGLPPVLFTPPGEVGFAIVGGIAAFAMVTYIVGARRVRAGKALPTPLNRRARRHVIDEMRRRKARRDGTPLDGVGRAMPPPQSGNRTSGASRPKGP